MPVPARCALTGGTGPDPGVLVKRPGDTHAGAWMRASWAAVMAPNTFASP